MTTDYTERAAALRDAHDRKLQHIRDRYQRHEITAELRDTLIARNTHDTRQHLADLREADQAARSSRRQSLEQRLFAPNDQDGNDPATRSEAFRTARDRAAQYRDPNGIAEELRKAIRAKDTLMQKALFEQAHDISMTTQGESLSGVVVSYINEVRPDLAEDYRELRTHVDESRSLGARFAREACYLIPTPTEIGNYQDHKILEVASDPRFADVT